MTQIVPGSIQAVSRNGDTALAILNAEAVILCDRSSSMIEQAWGGKSRYQLEDEVLTKLQKRYSGKIVLISFADVAYLVPSGNLPEPNGMTNMLDAFRAAEPLAEVGLKVILISDGEPSHEESEVIDAARVFHNNLDCIYVGHELSDGKRFMDRLAKSVNGTSALCDLDGGTKLLEEHIETLLLGSGR